MNTTKAMRQEILEALPDPRVRALVEDVEFLLDEHERRLRSIREALGSADAANAFHTLANRIHLNVPQATFRHNLNVEVALLEKERV